MTNSYVNDFSTTVKTYYNELKKYKPISREKEKELIYKAKNGDLKAQNEILTSNLRFVFNIASRYKGKGAPIDDLISEGNLGLIKAIYKFNPERNIKFISYAVWWIKNSIYEFIKKRQMELKIEKEEDSLYIVNPESLLKDESDDDYANKIETVLSDENDNKTKELQKGQKTIVNKILSKLNNRERFVIEQYYGINCDEKNLEEIGKILGITKERVRQIKRCALNKMRSDVLLLEVSEYLFK